MGVGAGLCSQRPSAPRFAPSAARPGHGRRPRAREGHASEEAKPLRAKKSQNSAGFTARGLAVGLEAGLGFV